MRVTLWTCVQQVEAGEERFGQGLFDCERAVEVVARLVAVTLDASSTLRLCPPLALLRDCVVMPLSSSLALLRDCMPSCRK